MRKLIRYGTTASRNVYYKTQNQYDGNGARFVIIAIRIPNGMLRGLSWSFAFFAVAALFVGAWNLAVLLVDQGTAGLSDSRSWIDILLVALWAAALLAALALMSRREWGRRLLQLTAAILAAITTVSLLKDYLDPPVLDGRNQFEWVLSGAAILYFTGAAWYLGTARVLAFTQMRGRAIKEK